MIPYSISIIALTFLKFVGVEIGIVLVSYRKNESDRYILPLTPAARHRLFQFDKISISGD